MYNLIPKARFSSSVGNGLFNSASLDLHFAKTKSLVDATTGSNLVDFTRASSGTYVGSDGLIKTATTNYLVYSEEFDQDAGSTTEWGHGPDITVTANDREAPNGTLTADKIVQSGSGSYLFQSRTVGAIASTSFTISLYVYAESEFDFTLRVRGNGSTQEAENFTVSTTANQWKRVSATKAFTSSADGTTAVISLYADVQGQSNNRTVWFWGAQLEQSTTVGEYVKTTSTINSAPRFDHDPTTGESLGLLVEESRTNFALQSEALDSGNLGASTGWYALTRATVIPDLGIAPNGSLTADKIVANTDNNNHNASNRTTPASVNCANPATASIFLKAAGESKAWLLITEGTSYSRSTLVYYDLTGLGSATTPANNNGATNSSATIEAYANGWYRCTLTTTLGGNDTRVEIRVGPSQSTSTNVYQGNNTDGIFGWGLQIEQGSFPTSYIPTTSSTVTRAADVASISGSNFSSWYRQDEGTLFNNSTVIAPNVQSQTVWSLTGGTYITSLRQPQNTGDKFRAQIGNSFTPSPGTGTTLSSGTRKACVAYLGTAGRLQVGSNSDDVTAAGVLDATQFNVGSLGGTSLQLNGTIRRLTYWPQRLPNDTLQTITQ